MFKEKIIFSKPALSIEAQINLLTNRGLNIANHSLASYYLYYIGYYRLSGYCRFYYQNKQMQEPIFKVGTTFEQVLDLYTFDREIRLLVLDAVERIEVSFRTLLSNWMSTKYHPHWYLDRRLFLQTFYYEDFIKTIENETGLHSKGGNSGRRNPIFSHYYNKYNDPPYPPSWMLAEGLSLGTWSRVYEYLKDRNDKSAISKGFNLPYVVLQSWLQSLTYLRNISAHHLIVWNRQFHITPCVPQNFSVERRRHFEKKHALYSQLAMLHVLVNVLSNGNNWFVRLKTLLDRHHEIPIMAMGFFHKWYDDPFWGSRETQKETLRESI